MKKIKNKFNYLILTLIITISPFMNLTKVYANDFNNATISPINSLQSVSAYESWILNQSNSGLTSKSELDETLNLFKQLDNEKKEQFLWYLSNPKLISDALLTDLDVNESRSFYNGDIVVSLKEVQSKNNSIRAYNTYETSFTRVVSLFGISIYEGRIFIKHTHNGSIHSDIPGTGAYTIRNIIPTLGVNWSPVVAWFSGNLYTAYAESICTTTFIHPDIPLTYNSATWQVWGNAGGQHGGSVTKN